MLRVKDTAGTIRLINPNKVVLATLKGDELTVELDGQKEPLVFQGTTSKDIMEELEAHGK